MPMAPLVGHEAARKVLARGIRSDSLPHSLLLYGPPGIGKERLGLWLAQLLLCDAPMEGEPCNTCTPCRRVQRLEHPDMHWFFPLPRPSGASGDKLEEKLEELRASELQARRDDPFHLPSYDRPPAHFLGAIRILQRLAGGRPSVGSHKVFLIGDAEAMVVQESSPEAANAFLKLLEEPPADTTLILTAVHPGMLLPTIRSRVLPVRLGPLAEAEVQEFLVRTRGASPEDASRAAKQARGAIGRALDFLPSDGPENPLQLQNQQAEQLLDCILGSNSVHRFAKAHEQPPTGGRGDFLGVLDALAEWLRDLLAVVASAPEQVTQVDRRAKLQQAVARNSPSPIAVADSIRRVGEYRDLASGNVNPQLILAELLPRLAKQLTDQTVP